MTDGRAERTIEETIDARRGSRKVAFWIIVAATVIAVLLYEILSTAGYRPEDTTHPSFWGLLVGFTNWVDVFVEILIVWFVAGLSWHFRGMENPDMYMEVIDKSTFALRLFRDQIDAEIDRRGEKAEQ